MSLKAILDQIDAVMDPKYAKAVIVLIALIVIERTVHVLITDSVIDLLSTQKQQRSLELILGSEVPMLKMTIFWPVVFLLVNVLHENIRVSKIFYNAVIYTNAIAATLAGLMLFDMAGLFSGSDFYYDDYFVNETAKALVMCYITTAFSIYVYNQNVLLFEKEENDSKEEP